MTSPVTAASYMQKARRTLEAARLLLANNDTEGACNRAYYAMFDAAHGVTVTVLRVTVTVHSIDFAAPAGYGDSAFY